MSHSGGATAFPLSDRARHTSAATLWGGLLLSLMFHAGVIVAVLWLRRPLGDGAPANKGEGEFLSVGIVPKKSNHEKTENESNNADANNPNTKSTAKSAHRTPQPEVPDAPPISLQQPDIGKKVIGPGTQAPAAVPRGDPGIVLPNRIGPPPSLSAGSRGTGKASFFDVKIEGGKRIVYVLDRSFSMRGLPLLFAKQKLIESLNGLSVEQKFQVIFFNQVPRAVAIHRGAADPLTPGSKANVMQAKIRIESVNDDGSTKHKLALRAALDKQRSPDVVFFLSDTDSQLETADLQEIKKMNRSGARIHCIEFGQGEDLRRGYNFLKQLAAMNRGKYVYVDVTKLRRR